ncbi:MAG: SEC-C domain-containing protein [Lachnospiraceae bacterium]|nr:SEC-C domain-containing protein [Lachnospiraceae bacterium]
MLSDAIEKAQMKIESNNYGTRKRLLDYDQVNNEQREVIYADRRRVLDGESMRDVVLKMITDIVDNTVDSYLSDDHGSDEWDMDGLNAQLCQIFPMEPMEIPEGDRSFNKGKLKQALKEKAVKLYEAKEAEFPELEQLREIERVILLKAIDRKWMDHIDDMDQLRQGIGLQAYGQKDPLIEYKMAGYEMFDAMTSSIQEETVRTLMRIKVEQKVEREQVAKVTGTNKDDSAVREPKRRENQKVYPNDPCPCGSGKKYKQCCGRKG